MNVIMQMLSYFGNLVVITDLSSPIANKIEDLAGIRLGLSILNIKRISSKKPKITALQESAWLA
jgi:hypothetical protein